MTFSDQTGPTKRKRAGKQQTGAKCVKTATAARYENPTGSGFTKLPQVKVYPKTLFLNNRLLYSKFETTLKRHLNLKGPRESDPRFLLVLLALIGKPHVCSDLLEHTLNEFFNKSNKRGKTKHAFLTYVSQIVTNYCVF